MHRTEAQGSVAGEYVDRNLPTVAGTKLAAVDRNTIQEEIAGVITRAGLTLKDAATDTNDQLEKVIFDTEFTRTSGFNFATAAPSISHAGPSYFRLWNITDGSQLLLKAGTGQAEDSLEYSSGTTHRIVRVGSSGITVQDGADTVFINGGGIAYTGPSLSAMSTTRSDFALTDSSFSPNQTSSGSCVWLDSSTNFTLTNLPFPKVIKNAWLSCRVAANGQRVCSPCNLRIDDNSGTCKVVSMSFVGPGSIFSATYDQIKLTVEYEN